LRVQVGLGIRRGWVGLFGSAFVCLPFLFVFIVFAFPFVVGAAVVCGQAGGGALAETGLLFFCLLLLLFAALCCFHMRPSGRSGCGCRCGCGCGFVVCGFAASRFRGFVVSCFVVSCVLVCVCLSLSLLLMLFVARRLHFKLCRTRAPLLPSGLCVSVCVISLSCLSLSPCLSVLLTS
jgi:hypothetical protein